MNDAFPLPSNGSAELLQKIAHLNFDATLSQTLCMMCMVLAKARGQQDNNATPE